MLKIFFFLYRWEIIIIFFFFLFFFFFFSRDYKLFLITNVFELDDIRISLIFLTILIIILSLLRRIKVKWNNNYSSFFLLNFIILLINLILRFSFSNYLFFYLRFEVSLLPTFFLILGWGYQPERIRAGIYIFIYTFLASLPLLLMILIIKYKKCRDYIREIIIIKDSYNFIFFFLIAFIVKFPIYILHIWLPKAHVEAPIAGSIILAGILLKLRGYGIMRVLKFFFFEKFRRLIISISLWGAFIIRLNCLQLIDIKAIIAYSSVVHIALCLVRLLTFNEWGIKGTLIIIVRHGLCSSGLFYLINVIYECTYSRRILLSKGILNLMPSISIRWFIILIGNMAAPPTINLLREISIFIRIINWNILLIPMLILIRFFSARYNLYLFRIRHHGSYINLKIRFNSNNLINYLLSFLHFFFFFVLIISIDFILI